MKHGYFFIFLMLWACPVRSQKLTQEITQQKTILAKDSNNIEALKEICFLYLHKADFDNAIYYGQKLFNIGFERQDYENAILYSHICLGQAHLMKGNRNAHNHLGQALSLGKSLNNDSALCSIYNGLGLYASNIEKDYHSAIRYFFEGIEAAKRCRYDRLRSILLVNLSGIYYLKNDTVGIKYATEAYELGHDLADPYIVYCSSLDLAYLHFLKKSYTQALQFIKEAEFIMLQNEFHDQARVYALYGQILTACNNPRQAIEYFEKGLEVRDISQTSSIVNTLYGYAQALRKINNPQQSILLLKEALTLTHEHTNYVYRDLLLEELSICYETLGMYQEALKYQRLYHIESDSLFNADKERILSDMRVKYDTERKENIIRQNKMELLRKEKKEQLLYTVILAIIIALLVFYYQYRRKNLLYAAIVKQNKEAVLREQRLHEQIQELEKQKTGNTADSEVAKYAQSPLTEEKKNHLFMQLEKLMQHKQVYKNSLLTKEKVAELLGTNRTYLSQAINEQTNQTFTQYINKHRINEAVRLLSDPQNDMPLKAISAELGFSSMTTFYKLFQTTIGMPPAQYKKKIQEYEKQSKL